MQTRQGHLLGALRGVQDFMTLNAADLGGVAASGMRRRLDAHIATINLSMAAQGGSHISAQGHTQALHVRRRTLVEDHMRPITDIARAELRGRADLSVFRVPARRPSTEQLYAAAVGMASAAAPYAAVFIEAGLDADFITQLERAADAMSAVVDARTMERGTRKGATAGLAETMADARRTMRALNSLVRRQIRTNAALLAAWNAVRRVQTLATRTAPVAETPVADTVAETPVSETAVAEPIVEVVALPTSEPSLEPQAWWPALTPPLTPPRMLPRTGAPRLIRAA